MKKLKNLLLVDDSPSSNFFNKKIIQKSECVENVSVVENGKEALAYLMLGNKPEVILLDVNMPVMNGWEFLAEYRKLDDFKSNSIIILMSGTKLNNEDEEKLKKLPEISEFRKKNLSTDQVKEIVDFYFKKEAC